MTKKYTFNAPEVLGKPDNKIPIIWNDLSKYLEKRRKFKHRKIEEES